jgi:hypothetical protein
MIEEFDELNIENASVQFIGTNGTPETGTEFGCVGTMEIEPELVTIVKKAGIEEQASVTKISYLTVTISAHIKRTVLEGVFGLSSDGLKTGVKAIGKNFKSKPFIFTAEVYDMDRVKKLIALPKVECVSGIVKSLDNSATEVPYVELEFRARYDANNNIYYEAYETEITDATVKNTWMTAFTPSLVEESTSI